MSARKVLIFTTGFGDGHNSAARNVRDAFQHLGGFDAEVHDPYVEVNPRAAKTLQVAYNISIQRVPVTWKAFFWLYDKTPVFDWTLPTLGKLKEAVRVLLRDKQPAAVVTTYPVYTYLLRELMQSGEAPASPHFMVVTDSIVINRVWNLAPADWVLVANDQTREAMVQGGTPREKIAVLGFPVSPRFEDLSRQSLPAGPPWRLLYLPSASRRTVGAVVKGLTALDGVHLTVVTGRHRHLHDFLKRLDVPMSSFALHGWTDRMPELLAESHLFIGKAGGAIVQETLAIARPMIISHVVAGQEEGNVTLLSDIGAGALATTPGKIVETVRRALLENGGAEWAQWRDNLLKVSHPAAARQTAEFVAAKLS
ncbi:MAG: MGDG synthase family glycosyltransferase [Chthoniobacterales bacterium]